MHDCGVSCADIEVKVAWFGKLFETLVCASHPLNLSSVSGVFCSSF